MRFLILLLLAVLLNANELYTRFLISKGDLLVDKGRYLEALDNYDSAYLYSKSSYVKLDAEIKKANVLYFYLLKPKEAYNVLISAYNAYPNLPNSEYALYFASMIIKNVDFKKALNVFKKYLEKYPNGKFAFQIRFFYKKLKKQKKFSINKNNLLIVKYRKIPKIRVLLLKDKFVIFKGKLVFNGYKYDYLSCNIENNEICCDDVCGKNLFIKGISTTYVKNKKRFYYGDFLLIYKNGLIYVVNKLNIEKYLYGVVTSESLSNWNIEALKAQAVASRTFAYYQTKVRKNWLYDVRDDTFDQVYKGASGITKKSILATKDTLGEVLIYKNRVILSQFCANVGWESSSSKEIFGVNFPYLYSHKDKFSAQMPRGKWIKRVSERKLEINFKKMGLDFGKIYKIVPYERVRSGRIIKIKIYAQKGSYVLKTYTSLRRAAGLYDILLKNIKKDGDYFIFKGGGFGHGVGYSQWGAEAMAEDGVDYKKILKFYYKDTEIKKLW